MDKHIVLKTWKSGLPEVLCWLIGIALLATMDPQKEHLFSFCPMSWLWGGSCPGCGLGHSIAYLFRGEWRASWEAHPLGLPALYVLGRRAFSLLRVFCMERDAST